jgi:hypothetical protein
MPGDCRGLLSGRSEADFPAGAPSSEDPVSGSWCSDVEHVRLCRSRRGDGCLGKIVVEILVRQRFLRFAVKLYKDLTPGRLISSPFGRKGSDNARDSLSVLLTAPAQLLEELDLPSRLQKFAEFSLGIVVHVGHVAQPFEHSINEAAMFYATASQGFRPGGANQVIGLSADLTPYRSDSLWNYEIGSKFTLLDRKLTLNLAAYQIDWTNIQVSGRTTNGAFSFLSNAGAARIRGVEAEAFLRPMRGLQLTLSGNYIDPKLTEDQVNESVVAAGRAGDRIPFIPNWSGAVGAEYTTPVSNSLDFFARADVNYVGSSYSEFRATNVYRVKIGAYSLTNLRIGFDLKQSDAGVYLFVNNLFDEVAINRASQSSTANSYSATSAAPRTIGLNVRKSF